MAFPTVSDADTKNGTVTTNSTSWTLTYPTNIAAGDLLLAFVASDGSNGPGTWPAGWVASGALSAVVSIIVAKKKAVGTETGTFTLTLANTEQGAWRIFRIPADTWEGTLGTTFFYFDTTGGSVQGAFDNYANLGGASANPNPLNLDPDNWVTEDTLWLAGMAADTSRTVSAYPSNMPDRRTADVSGGSTGATLGMATATSAVSSFNPDAFTISASDEWTVATVAVRPAAVVVDRVPYFRPMPQLLAQ